MSYFDEKGREPDLHFSQTELMDKRHKSFRNNNKVGSTTHNVPESPFEESQDKCDALQRNPRRS